MRIFGYRLTATAVIGMAIVVINVGVAVLAPLIAPYDQADLVGAAFAQPSPDFWLGTDNLGRDMLSRLMYGARASIGLALAITGLCFVVGITAGFAAAAAGKTVDMVLSRLADVMLSLPDLIFAFVVLSVLGTSLTVLVTTIAVISSTKVFRVARSIAMNVMALEFVEAARARGEGLWWVMWREVWPNALPPLMAEFGLRFCFAFLFVAALSFLGLGIQPPDADWGSMVRDLRDVIAAGSVAPLYPAAAIAVLTVGVNFIVDWMVGIHSRGQEDGR